MYNNCVNFLIVFFWIFILYIFYNIFFGSEGLNNVNTNTLKNNSKVKIYNFNASWCGHCQHFKPIWNQFVSTLDDDSIEAIDVRCDLEENKKTCSEFDVPGFPYVLIVKDDVKTPYDGPRTVKGLRSALKLKNNKIPDINNKIPDINNKIPNINNKIPNIDIKYPDMTNNLVNKDFLKTFTNKLTKIIENDGKINIYNFNTSWCSYSRSFQPVWDKFVKTLDPEIYSAKDIKCEDDANKELCNKYNVPGYPTVVMDSFEPVNYEGPRTVNGLRSFLKLPPIEENSIALDETTIDSPADINDKITIYNFNTAWCGYSVKFQPEWNKFYNSLRSSDNIHAIDVKCDKPENEALCDKYQVPGYPYIVINNKGKIDPYNGPRESNAIRKFLNL
jgi:thiol-disulfide isomerase/thioredoxin